MFKSSSRHSYPTGPRPAVNQPADSEVETNICVVKATTYSISFVSFLVSFMTLASIGLYRHTVLGEDFRECALTKTL